MDLRHGRNPKPIDRNRAATILVAGALLALSLALRHAFPIQAEAGAIHDDALYVRLAASVASGAWLGPYDQVTLAKGAAYPVFIALTYLARIPLKMAEHGVYLAGCLVFAAAMGTLYGSRVAGLAILAFLALNPVFWSEESVGRVIREGLYIGLVAWIFGLSVYCFVLGREGTIREELRRKWWRLLALGAAGGAFWLTREEGVWLAPSVVLLAASWAWRARRPAAAGGVPRHVAWMAGFFALPFVAAAAVVAAMNAANLHAYGAFVNSELRSGEFRAAYGALARIEHARWTRFVPLPVEARQAAYAASPAARELEPFLEGPVGKAWLEVGCAESVVKPEACTEFLAGWLVWALRDAAAAAGHFRSAATSAAFFERVAREVNAACDSGTLRCGPRRDTLAPPWRTEYEQPVAAATLSVGKRLLTLGDMHVRPKRSSGSPEQIALFQRMTQSRLAGPEADKESGLRLALAERIARVQVAVTTFALPAALLAWLLLLAWQLLRRRPHLGHVVVAALAAAAVVRVGLLGVLDATSFPADNLTYLTPVTPLAIAIAPCVAFLLLAAWRSGRRA